MSQHSVTIHVPRSYSPPRITWSLLWLALSIRLQCSLGKALAYKDIRKYQIIASYRTMEIKSETQCVLFEQDVKYTAEI
jgi:hypothetical protein